MRGWENSLQTKKKKNKKERENVHTDLSVVDRGNKASASISDINRVGKVMANLPLP